MSIQLEARITADTTLDEVLAQAERLLSRVPHDSFTIDSTIPASKMQIGSFTVPEHGPERRKDVFTIWEHGYLRIAMGPIATINLAVAYAAFPHELEPWPGRPLVSEEDNEEFGYQASVDAGGHRTRASFALAALLISAVAIRNRTRIIDDVGRLKCGRLIDPAKITAMFAKHRDARSFEELADAFCDEIDFAPNWPRAAEELAKLRS